jgi:transposase
MVSEEAYAAVVAENAQLRERIAQLEAALADALGRLGELEAAKKAPPPFVKATVPERPKRERTPRAPEHNRGRRREEPTRIVEHRPECCAACGGRLGGLTLARVRQVVELAPPPPVEVTEHRVYRGWCSYCGQWRAARPDLGGQVLGRGRLGMGVAALVAHLRVGLRLPLRPIRAYLADVHGLRVSVGELVDLLRRVAAAGRPAYEGLRARVRASAVALGDETTWREAGRNGYVWHTGTPDGVRYYEYHHSRAGAVINELLGEDFAGVLVSDFYAGYNDTPGGQHQRCWVHLLRDLHELKRAHADAPEVVAWARAVKRLYQRAVAIARRLRAADAQHPPPAREPAYQQLVAAAVALGARFAQAAGHPCHALAQRLLRHQGELFTFVLRDDVPADNNGAERGVRPVVVARKISGGTRSPQGSHTRMVLTSLAETWRAQGLNPLDQFRRLLQSPLPQI